MGCKPHGADEPRASGLGVAWQAAHLVSGPLDLYRHYEVSVVDRLKGAMHKSFIQVNDHTDSSLIFLCHLWEQAGPWDLIKLVLETLEQIRLSNGVGFLLIRGELSGGAGLANMLGSETAEKGLEDITSTRLLRRGLGDQALLGEHQGVFPPRLGDDGAVFHLTIPRARAGWAGGRAGAQACAGLGGLGGGPLRLRLPRLRLPLLFTCLLLFPPWAGKGGGLYRERAAPAAAPPGAPGPDPPAAAPGSSVWVQHGESGAKTRGGNGTRGGFQAPPSPPYSR